MSFNFDFTLKFIFFIFLLTFIIFLILDDVNIVDQSRMDQGLGKSGCDMISKLSVFLSCFEG